MYKFSTIVLLLILALYTSLPAQSREDIRITGSFTNAPTSEVLNFLGQKGQVKFYYKEEWLAQDSVTVKFANHKFNEAVDLLFSRKPYTYKIINESQVILLPKAEVAMLSGQIRNYSNNGSDKEFVVVGNLADAGKYKNAAITGSVSDGKSGEPIIGATIQIQNMQQGAVSNTEGEYKLILTPGLYTLVVSSVGFETSEYNIKAISSGNFNIELFDKSVRFDDIIIYGQRLDKNVSSHQMSMVEMNIREISQLPSVSGGKDVLKGLTIMPGIKSIGEFSSGINVRGGGEDQNLYLINAAPIFYTSHVFGLISVVNPDAVDKLSLYKGHIPASFGERVSSVIDIRTKDNAPLKTGIKGGIGLYDSRLMFEVPLIKEKLFFNLAGRMSYSGWILKQMKDYDLRNSEAGFYDVNGTLHFNSGKSHISLSGYTSYDEFRFSSFVKYQYQSQIASLNWNYLFNSSFASYLTLAYSDYDVNKDVIGNSFKASRTNSGIRYSSLKYRLQYGGINKHNVEGGFSMIRYDIRPANQRALTSISIIGNSSLDPEQAYEGAVFLNDEYTVNGYLVVNAGFRYSGFANIGPGHIAEYQQGLARDTVNITGYKDYGRNEMIRFYQGFEPRISARVKLSDVSSVKMSYNRNLQYLSMINYTSVSTPSDIWKLADSYLKPIIANQFALGYYRNFFNNSIEVSAEVYYKTLKNVVEFTDASSLVSNGSSSNRHPETELFNANGQNYGIELLLKKTAGTLDGWISYTYSRSLRKTNGYYPDEIINNNRYYPSSFDRPHDFSVIANFHLNKRIVFSGNFSFSSGRPITLPEMYFDQGTDQIAWFSERNKYRIPNYHRLDLTMTMNESLKLHKKWKGYWSFSVLNVYGRKNPYTIFYKKEQPNYLNDYERFNLYKLYLIGKPMPTLSYTFVF